MPSVAIIGTRGYPSYYGGFETAVRKLAPYLADEGWDVTVYGRPGATRPDDPHRDPRVRSIETRGIESKSLSTLSYGFSAVRDSIRRRADVALVMNVANGYWLPMLRRASIPTLVNVDGIEWDRAKWNRVAKRAFFQGAKLTAKYADELVFDANAIGDRWRRDFDRGGTFLPYGGDCWDDLQVPLQLDPRGYILLVARFVPENTVAEFFEAVPRLQELAPVVLVGSAGYGGELDARAADLAHTYSNVHWLGHVSDDSLLASLWQHAGVYFHGHSVGGTNPALVQAMALGAPIIARETIYNSEVLDDPSQLCRATSAEIIAGISSLLADPNEQERMSVENMARAASHYSWDTICAGYERTLRGLLRSQRHGADADLADR